jgi:D-glycero-alpha-D-manno-heptose-7-phosphate kinase
MDNKIVRARAPLRLGLAGGGTDLSPYCDRHGGAVLNVTINRYASATIETSADGLVHFVAPDVPLRENFFPEMDPKGANLSLHAGVCARMCELYNHGVVPAVTVTSYVDAPPGSGLGSSSALVVALVSAWAEWFGATLGVYDVAHLAWQIEREDLGLAGGKQDQYAATFGGFNFIEFHAQDRVIVNPLRVQPDVLHELDSSMVICFSGVSRSSADIIQQQQEAITVSTSTALSNTHKMKQDALDMRQALVRGDVAHMATILNRSWQAKKQTAQGISTERIEQLYDAAFAAGALGGKVSGAGGGGFLMFMVPPQQRVQVIDALNNLGGTAGGAHFVMEGAHSWSLPATAGAAASPVRKLPPMRMVTKM